VLAADAAAAHGLRLADPGAALRATGRGALTFGVTTAQVFTRSREGLASPDLQLLFTPASYRTEQVGVLEKLPGMTVAVCPVRPDSRGSIMATSSDPFARPAIRPNYLATYSDQQVLLSGIRQTREIFAQAAIARHCVTELAPTTKYTTDAELEDQVRLRATTIYHPVGTCKMGVDAAAVVDPKLQVRGVEGLRVCDASVMPSITGGNTNAPAIMIGERGADFVLGHHT